MAVGDPRATAEAAAVARRASLRRASTGRPPQELAALHASHAPVPATGYSTPDRAVAQPSRISFENLNSPSENNARRENDSVVARNTTRRSIPGNGRESTAAFAVNSTQNNAQGTRNRSTVRRGAQSSRPSRIGAFTTLRYAKPSVHSFNRPRPPGHVAVSDQSQDGSMSRPRAGRGGLGRDTRDGDMETDLLNRVIDAVKKAKEHNDNCQRLGSQIVDLESEIKAKGASTPEQHRKLDALYRDMMRNAEQEKRVNDEEDVVNNLAIIVSLKTADEPPPRPTGHPITKRKAPRPTILESDVVADSPGPSPGDRLNDLKRNKPGQRSSSVASTGRSGTVLKGESTDVNRGIQAEKAGQLIVGAEVFYRFPRGSPDDLGIGIQCIIKKVWQDKKPIVYDVQDPDVDPSGKQNVHRAQAKDLIPIPPAGTSLQTFPVGAIVFARYPDTDTFYKAEVRGIQKGEYTLRFDGEEDDKEQPVEKRFVLDSKVR